MINRSIKKIISILPVGLQQGLKRYQHGRQIAAGKFVGGEPEFDRLAEWVAAGDWVIDLGANIGHYTHRLSDLAGPEGRVIAFEPMVRTFELLSANVARFRHPNVSLINAAASSSAGIARMDLPNFTTGLDNYYRASINATGHHSILTLPVDNLQLHGKVTLVKIDVEGHEFEALQGMTELLRRDRPTLIVESSGDERVEQLLTELGYQWTHTASSPNRVYIHIGAQAAVNPEPGSVSETSAA